MDRGAIEQIQDTADISGLMKQIECANTKSALAILPNSFRVENLDQFMPNKAFYEMRFKTSDFDAFVFYCAESGGGGQASCFVHDQLMTAKTIFDLGSTVTPGHQKHTAELTLKRTAAFSSLQTVLGMSPLSQRAIADWIEDWADMIEVRDSHEIAMSGLSASKSLRDLTIETAASINSVVGDFSESMSAMEKIEAGARHQTPGTILFSCVPYVGISEKTFILRLGIRTGGDKPKIVVRLVKGEEMNEQITAEFTDRIIDEISSASIKTYIGSAS